MNSRGLQAAAILVVAAALLFVGFQVLGNDPVDSAQQEVVTELTNIAPPTSTVEDAAVDAPSTDNDESLATEIEPPSADAEDDFPALVTDAVRDSEAPVELGFTIVDTIDHDTDAFTQGLEISNDRLFESTGLVGRSSIRELDLATGDVLRLTDIPDVFAEGLTIVDDTALQITWQDQIAYRYDLDTFELLDTYSYEGQGWGLCHDGAQLVMSDGTSTLDFRDPDTFELRSSVDVTLGNDPVTMINELECVNGSVFANIWLSSLIIEIEPSSGEVIGVLNANALTPESVDVDSGAVLNGIAYDATDGTFLLTGKLWPTIYRVQISPVSQ